MPTPHAGHNRLWLWDHDGTPTRLNYLRDQALANSLKWQHFNPNSADTYEVWQFALKYRVLKAISDADPGNSTKAATAAAYLTTTLGVVDTFISNCTTGTDGGLFFIFHQTAGLYYHFPMRCAAWFYDTMNAEIGATRAAKLKDIMLAATSFLFDPTGIVSLVANPSASGYGADGFETEDPYSNHHAQQICGATYAAVALQGETLTWQWPVQSGTVHTFSIPYSLGVVGSDPTGPPFSIQDQFGYDGTPNPDLFAWVIQRVETMILPAWDADMGGGYHPEGFNYGMASIFKISELARILDISCGPGYMPAHRCFKNAIMRLIYDLQPNDTDKLYIGDYPRPTNLNGNLADSDILSVLVNIDGNRGTDEAACGQYFLNTFWPDPNNALGREPRGNYFLMWKDTEPTINYRSSYPKYYLDDTAATSTSRSAWNNSAMMVSHVCGKKWKEHQGCTVNHVQLWAGGKPLIRKASYGQGIIGGTPDIYLWHAHGHNNHVLFINAHATIPAADTLSRGWSAGPSHRWNPPDNFVAPDIPRFCGNTAFVYSQGLAHDAFCTYKLGAVYEGHCVENIPESLSLNPRHRLSRYYSREVVHYLGATDATGIMITFDRFAVQAAYVQPDTWIQARWHYGVQPVVIGTPAITTIADGTAKTFRRTMLSTPGSVEGYTDESSISGAAPVGSPSSGSWAADFRHGSVYDKWAQLSYREEISIPLNAANGGYGRYCNVFEVATTAQAAMTPMTSTPPTGVAFSNGPTGGFTMAGVTIQPKQKPYLHFLFSEEQNAACPTLATPVAKQIDYVVGKTKFSDGAVSAMFFGDLHRVFNLVPNQHYIVTETRLSGVGGSITGYYWYHLEPNTQGDIIANSAGVAEFRIKRTLFGKNTKLTPVDQIARWTRAMLRDYGAGHKPGG